MTACDIARQWLLKYQQAFQQSKTEHGRDMALAVMQVHILYLQTHTNERQRNAGTQSEEI